MPDSPSKRRSGVKVHDIAATHPADVALTHAEHVARGGTLTQEQWSGVTSPEETGGN